MGPRETYVSRCVSRRTFQSAPLGSSCRFESYENYQLKAEHFANAAAQPGGGGGAGGTPPPEIVFTRKFLAAPLS